MIRYIFHLIIGILLSTNTFGQQTFLNTDFGASGKTIVNIDPKNNDNYNAAAITVGLDNSIYVGGNLRDEFVIQKMLASGRDDSSFGYRGFSYFDYGEVFNNGLGEILRYPDGKLLLIGTVSPCVSLMGRNISGNGMALIKMLPGGSVDTSFGIRGKVFFTVGYLALWASTGLIQPDGKIIVVCRGGPWDGANALNVDRVVLFRFNADGSRDNTFGTGGIYFLQAPNVSTQANKKMGLALQPDGKILLGDVSAAGPSIFRIKAAGKLDSTFGVNGVYSNKFGFIDGQARSIVVQPDGKIVVAGNAVTSSFPYLTNWLMYRLQNNGQIDNTFANNGVFVYSRPSGRYQAISHIEMQGNDRILGAGFHNTTSQGFIDVFKFKLNGTFDSSFAQTSVIYQQQFLSAKLIEEVKMALDADQNPTVLGHRGQFYAQNDGHMILRLSKDGVIVPAFNNTGIETYANAVGSQNLLDYNFGSRDKLVGITQFINGKILLAGNAVRDGTVNNKIGLVRLTSSGKIDSSFGVNGIKNPMVDNAVAAMNAFVKLSDEKIIFNRNSNTLVKIDSTGKIDSTFGTNGLMILSIPDINGFPSSIRSLTQQADQKIIVLSNHYIHRLLVNGTLDNSFGTNGAVNMFINSDQVGQKVECQPDGKIVAAATGPTGALLYRCLSDGVVDAGFGLGGKTPLNVSVPGQISFSNIFRDFKFMSDGSIIAVCMKNRFYGLTNSAYNDQVIAGGANYRDIVVYKFKPNGTIDGTFGGVPNPMQYFGTSHLTLPFVEEVPGEVVITPEGKILISGFFNRGSGWDIGVVQLKSNGRYDTTCIVSGMRTINEDNFIERNSINSLSEYKLHLLRLQNGLYLLGATKHGQNADYFVANITNINGPAVNYLSFAGAPDPICFRTNLSWSTNYECNVDSFYIEHSTDSINFVKIGSVKNLGTANNNYQFSHLSAVYGNNFYRIRLFSSGIVYDYSQVIKIVVDNSPLATISWSSITYTQTGSLFDVELKWQTMNEVMTTSFDIQVSTDSVNYQTVHTLNAGGTTTGITNYSYTVTGLSPGKYFFRLLLRGANCRTMYSVVRSIELKGCASVLKAYPNPIVDDILIVKIPQCENGDIRLINALGQAVMIYRSTGTLSELRINCAKFASGMYVLEFIGQKRTVIKLVKL